MNGIEGGVELVAMSELISPHHNLFIYSTLKNISVAMSVKRYPQLKEYNWLYQRYWIEELSSLKIAEELGCIPKAVRDALRRRNIPIRTTGDSLRLRKRIYWQLDDKDWLYERYWIEKLSTTEIGIIIGCSATSVSDAMEKIGIPRRSLSEATKNVTSETKKKRSEALTGRTLSEEHKKNLSKSWYYDLHFTEETRRKLTESQIGEKHWAYGKHFSDDHQNNLSESHRGMKCPWVSKSLKGQTGEKARAWKGGISFEPYCPKFNDALKEEIREKFSRVCFLCPKTEEENGRKLDVHHVDYNKEQGCNGVRWLLVPLCMSCNARVNKDRDYWQDFITEKMRKEGYLDDNN